MRPSRSSLRCLYNIVDILQMIIHRYLYDRMTLFYCEASRLGSFKRGVSGLGLSINSKPKSTLGLLVLCRGWLLRIVSLVFPGQSHCHHTDLLIVTQTARSPGNALHHLVPGQSPSWACEAGRREALSDRFLNPPAVFCRRMHRCEPNCGPARV